LESSCLNAAAKILDEKGEPMFCKKMIEAMATKAFASPRPEPETIRRLGRVLMLAALIRQLRTESGMEKEGVSGQPTGSCERSGIRGQGQ